MKDANPSAHDLHFLDEKHSDFKGFRGVRDNVARGSRNAGIGATVNIVTSEEEDLLWSIDILRMSSPRVLSNTILFFGILSERWTRALCYKTFTIYLCNWLS